MIMRSRYLSWATHFGRRAEYNLLSSGIPALQYQDFDESPDDGSADLWERLRKSIARHNGVQVGETIGVIGASHGLWLGYLSMVAPGEEILIESPTYEPLILAADASGARVRFFDRGVSCGFALDPDKVFSEMTADTRVVAITNSHNPSGVRASDESMRAIAARLESQGGFLFVDEIYSDFGYLEDPKCSRPKTARLLGPNVVTTASLNKVYGLGPERVGWILGPPDVIGRSEELLNVTLGELPINWMKRCISSFAQTSNLADRSRRLIGSKRVLVGEWVNRHRSLSWSNPSVGLFGFVSCPEIPCLREAIEAGVERHGVVVAPGEFFGMPNGFRIAWSLPEQQLNAALVRLDHVLNESEVLV